jgi:hypothetical protein
MWMTSYKINMISYDCDIIFIFYMICTYDIILILADVAAENGAMVQGDLENEGDGWDNGRSAAADNSQARSKQTKEKNAVEEMDWKLTTLDTENAALKKVMHCLFLVHGKSHISYVQSASQVSSAEHSASVLPKHSRYAFKAQANAASAPPSVIAVNVQLGDSLLK